MRTVISKGRLIDPANNLDRVTDLYIEKGKIIAVGKSPKNFTPDRTIDANSMVVCPGIVDLSARLGEPGYEYKATIASETAAAASAGITSICCPPDTWPVIDTTAVVELIHQRTLNAKKAHVYPIGALTQGLKGETLAEMQALKQAGCIGVANACEPINDTAVLRRALEYASTCNLTVHLFCEDGHLREDGVVHEGIINVRLGLPGIPETAETIAISRALFLMEQTGARIHFCRISSSRSIELIAQAKRQGLPVTADVSISHLFLTEMDLTGFNSSCYLQPPLRSETDRKALLKGVTKGTIDAVCSDHHPHDDDAKCAPFSMTEPGASTIDVLLPLVLQLVENKQLELDQAIAVLTINPARIAGLDAGHLSVGANADICIFDPAVIRTVDKNMLMSAGKNSPFLGWEVPGRVVRTFLTGRSVYK